MVLKLKQKGSEAVRGGRFVETLQNRLLSWYGKSHRHLPWRQTRDPYAIWVSEIMLQQTRVETVLPYYERFLTTFPTIEALASAPLENVLKIWENLGYYARVRNLHRAAQQVVEHFRGEIPAHQEALLNLPGIGPYTANALLSFAFHKHVATVDGNVRRVLCRLFALQEPLKQIQDRLDQLAEDLVPRGQSADHNQALMDLGAMICIPRRPACHACPLQSLCLAHQQGLSLQLPVRTERRPIPHKDAVAGILKDSRERILMVRRPDQGLLGGLWRFPGGEVRAGEDLKAALTNRIREDVGMEVTPGERLATAKHAYSHFRITLHAFSCTMAPCDREAPGKPESKWIAPGRLHLLAMSKVERAVLVQFKDRPGWEDLRFDPDAPSCA